MALAPVIQPPIMHLLTSREERLIRMMPPPRISRRIRIIFPILVFLTGSLLIPSSKVLLGMLCLGNLFRVSGIADRLDKTLSGSFHDIVTLLLALAVGLSTSGTGLLSWRSIGTVILGCCAFVLATACGILFAKLMNLFAKRKINPLIGGAVLSATPITAQVSCRMALEEDPENNLLPQAMASNLAGLIALALASGLFLGILQ
jgi:oxaloacetate decarboxylase beta subunit